MKKFANSIRVGDILAVPDLQNKEYKVIGISAWGRYDRFNIRNISDDSDIRQIFVLSEDLSSTEFEVTSEAE